MNKNFKLYPHKLIILCGKSASGKDTVLTEIVNMDEKKLKNTYDLSPIKRAISYTSRPIRSNETNDIDYHFVSSNDFIGMISNNDLLEYRSYQTYAHEGDTEKTTWYYGLSKDEIDLNKSHYCVVLDLDGTDAAIETFGRQNCVIFYINVSEEERTRRATQRSKMVLEEWERRLNADNEDFEIYRVINTVTEIIDNENQKLENVVDQVLHYVAYGILI